MKNKRTTPAKKWLLVLGVICMAFLVYDIIGEGGFFGGTEETASTDQSGSVDLSVQEPGTTGDSAYYQNYQLEREQVRSKELALLDEVINSEGSSEGAKDEASKKKIAISGRMEQELIIENLLEAKNFVNSAAFIQDDKVTVVLDGELDDNQATQVADIVDGVTGIGFENVVIVKRQVAQ